MIAAEPPHKWLLRIGGWGEQADLTFELKPLTSGTRLTLTAEIRNGPAILSPILDRVSSGLDQRMWRSALERIRTELNRDAVAPVVGGVYALEGGGYTRIGHVLAFDDQHVHLELRAGWCVLPPTGLDDIVLVGRRVDHHTDLRPLPPVARPGAAFFATGTDSLLADGGFGLLHAAMTRRGFHGAAPRFLGSTALPADAETRNAAWREREGAAFGEAHPPRVGALLSVALRPMGVDSTGFGIVKLLHQEPAGVHLRTYSNTFAERPKAVTEANLSSLPVDIPDHGVQRQPTELVAVGHVPVGHGRFDSWKPEYIAMALVHPAELRGYEEWKLANGGYF